MRLSRIGRVSMALVVSVAMGLGMTACGGGTVAYMWVLGTQYNQIAGFKVDNFTGNLTQVLHSPFSSGGADPVSLVVTLNGRYVYVINHGTGSTGAKDCGGATGGIAQFSVGGGGTLSPQQCFTSQGSSPVWAVADSSSNFLYVLDQIAPTANCSGANANNPNLCFGDITVFSIDPDTGRLSLVLNQQIKDSHGQQLTYFPVGNQPSMMQFAGGGCLMTLDRGDQTVFPYSVGAGQLTRPTNSNINLNSVDATSISVNGSDVYITDAGPTTASPGGYILPYTIGTSCSLNTGNGGAVANLPLTSNPSYSMVDQSGQYLYVLNQSTTNSNQPSFSSISAFFIDRTTRKLSPLIDSGNNPYKVGAGPVCMVEDPTSQYMYVSNADGTVTGKLFYKPHGTLSDLKRGSTFTAAGHATCLAISGNVQ